MPFLALRIDLCRVFTVAAIGTALAYAVARGEHLSLAAHYADLAAERPMARRPHETGPRGPLLSRLLPSEDATR